jgi:flagellar export protein FliJ
VSGFRLATVERLREQQLKACVQRLHGAAQELAQAQQAQEGLRDRLKRRPQVGTTDSNRLLLESHYRERLRGDLLAGADLIAELAEAVLDHRAAWLHAHAQLRAIQALHERYRVTRRTAIARQEQRELDELAGSGRYAISAGPPSAPAQHGSVRS